MNESTTSSSKVSDTIIQDLRTIPLWKRAKDSTLNTLLCSVTAKVAEQKEFLVPWIKYSDNFVARDEAISYKDCMEFLQVERVATTKLINDYIFPLPSTISEVELGTYQALISALADYCDTGYNWSNVDSAIRKYDLAADGNLSVTHVSNLFEAEDEVFGAAFRIEERTKLLHESVRRHKSFWRRAGIRHRASGRFTANDYLECLDSIARRLLLPWTEQLRSDVSTVLAPLIIPSSSTDHFDLHAWNRLAAKRCLDQLADFDPSQILDGIVWLALPRLSRCHVSPKSCHITMLQCPGVKHHSLFTLRRRKFFTESRMQENLH
jgi:hypothetical protein